MFSVAATAYDTIILNGLTITDTPDGDVATLTYTNDLFNVKTGKNGNVLVSRNEAGRQAELVLRVLRGSNDDKAINAFLLVGKDIPVGTTLVQGVFTKVISHGIAGKNTKDTYILTQGVISKQPEVKYSADGDEQQNVTTYTFKFGNVERVLL